MAQIITICSSANFYQKVAEVETALRKLGFEVIIPVTVNKMKASGDWDASHYRTWLSDSKDYHKKASLMRGHFDEVAKGDICLVVNEEKHGIQNYIGGNVVMEMALAFYLKKPLYLLNEMPSESVFLEELLAVEPMILRGDLSGLKSS